MRPCWCASSDDARNRDAIIGVSVSDTNAEMTMVIDTQLANSRKSRPTMLTTHGRKLADTRCLLLHRGRRPRSGHEMSGWHGRLDAHQAAILCLKLRQ